MNDSAIWMLFLLPTAATLGAGVLFYSKGPESTGSRWRDYVGLLVLVLVVVWQGYFASQDLSSSLLALFAAVPGSIASLAVGLVLIFASRRWRKLLGGIVGMAFPVALISAAVAGSYFAPPELTVGESALRTTKELLNSINKARPATPSYLWVDDDCWLFLRETVSANSGQYTLTLLSAYDSADNPYAVHDYTEASVQVDFPDGRQAKLWLWNGGMATCRYNKAAPN